MARGHVLLQHVSHAHVQPLVKSDSDNTTTSSPHYTPTSPCRYVFQYQVSHRTFTKSPKPRDTVVVETSPPAYPGGYGTIEVHHHHHHTLRSRGPRNSCCRALAFTLLILMVMTSFSAVCFVAWNFYNLSECEKERMPWDKPCKDWLGKDSFFSGTSMNMGGVYS